MKDIHQKNLVHHDFHSGNILKGIDKTSCLIADLGLCRPADKQDQKNKVYGVIPYVAPEVLDSKPYTQKSDVYSFGIIMVEILTGLPPYVVYDEEKKLYKETPHDVNLALKICGGQRPQFQIKIPQLLEDLIKNCWNSDPNQRPTANELERILRIWEQEINLKDPKETDKYFYSESGFGNDEFNYYLIRNKNSVKKTEQAHFTSQFQEAEEHNKTLPEEIKFPNYQKKIHKGAIYTSRLLSFKSLPQPQNNLSQEWQTSTLLNLQIENVREQIKILKKSHDSSAELIENFVCDNCQTSFHRAMAYSIAQNLEELKDYPAYCINCVKLAEQELKILVENIRLKIDEVIYQNEKMEWELNQDKSEDYVIIDKKILELEQKIAEWEKILAELENKLSNFQISEQQALQIQPTYRNFSNSNK